MSLHNDWKELDDTRLIMENAYDILIIKPKVITSHMPLFCPVCCVVMDEKIDMFVYEKFECCEPCANTWAFIKAHDWHTGWRPSKDAINEAVLLRKHRSSGFNNK